MTPADPTPVLIDLADFDAVGIMVGVVNAVRSHAILASLDTAATVSAPDDWHRVVITARQSGHVIVAIAFSHLSRSRWNNVARALEARGWQTDEDDGGATVRFPPGTDASEAAFEVLAVSTLSGAPADVRQVTAVDSTGTPVALG